MSIYDKLNDTFKVEAEQLKIKNRIPQLVETHLENWISYYEVRSYDEVLEELYGNHDPSIEVEAVEELLNRELNDEEYEVISELFNDLVLVEFKCLKGLETNLI